MAQSTKDEMQLSTGEQIQRLGAIRAEMRARKLDALLVYSQRRSHVAYVSGYRPNYHTNSAFVVLPVDDEPVLLIKFGFDLQRAKVLTWVSDIRTLDGEPSETLFGKCLRTMQAMKLGRARIGYVAGDDTVDELSVALLASMQEGLPSAHLEPAGDLLLRLRLQKGPGEVLRLRRATELAETAIEAVGRSLQPGVEDYALAAAASCAALQHGAERCDLVISPSATELALPPMHRRFSNGNVVSCELTVVCEGYWVQICRTFSMGEPTPAQKHLFAACRDAYLAGTEVARPGCPVSVIAVAAMEVLRKAGFHGCLTYGLGHGIGLDLPEPYEVELHTHDSLVNNMALAVHVGAWAPQAGAAAFVGGPILVSERGSIPLDRQQTELILA